MYESPIELIFHTVTEDINQRINEKIEKDFYEFVTVNYGINVSKEELLKVLAYDRDQYSKGYQDGKKDWDRGEGEWIENPLKDFVCSRCSRVVKIPELYCPGCGSKNTYWEDEEDG